MNDLHPSFQKDYYRVRKTFFKMFGESFHVYDRKDQVVFFSRMKAFNLKEDIRIYDSEAENNELLNIQAREIIDFSATYDVVDSTTGRKVGALARKGMKSLFKDEYTILDRNDEEIGTVREDSTMAALFRRFGPFGGLYPQTYYLTSNRGATPDGNAPLTTIDQQFNPLIQKYELDLTALPDTDQPPIDRRLIVATGIILGAIEGDQE